MFVLRLPFHYLLLCFRFVLFLFNQRHLLFYVFFPLLFRLLAHILCFAFCFFSFLRILFPSLFLLNSYNSFSIIHSDFTKYSLGCVVITENLCPVSFYKKKQDQIVHRFVRRDLYSIAKTTDRIK